MRLVWTHPASADRKEIREYIALHNPAAALALDELLEEKAGRLVDHPGLGKPGRVAGTRELVVHQNYILVYDTAGDLVRVLRVLHAARRTPVAVFASALTISNAGNVAARTGPANLGRHFTLFAAAIAASRT